MKDALLSPTSGFPPCVVGSVPDWETWCRLSDAPDLPCDLVELRVDALPETVTPAEIMAHPMCRPVLVTYRHESEGGLRRVVEGVRMQTVLELLPFAAVVDWEINRLGGATELVEEAHRRGVVLVASAHDFERTPSWQSLFARAGEARTLGADVVKFAFRLNSGDDLLTGVRLLRASRDPLAVMGMGPLGPVSRLVYAQYGSRLVYGFLGGTPTAPGQWTAEMCRSTLDALSPVEPE